MAVYFLPTTCKYFIYILIMRLEILKKSGSIFSRPFLSVHGPGLALQTANGGLTSDPCYRFSWTWKIKEKIPRAPTCHFLQTGVNMRVSTELFLNCYVSKFQNFEFIFDSWFYMRIFIIWWSYKKETVS